MSKHKAIGDNSLDALVPAGKAQAAIRASKRGLEPCGTTPRPGAYPPGAGEVRLTVHLPVALIDRVKNAVYCTPRLALCDEKDKLRAGLGAAQRKTRDGKNGKYAESSLRLFGADGKMVWCAPR